jgi:EPS-associated MarR family transcriptional regulator
VLDGRPSDRVALATHIEASGRPLAFPALTRLAAARRIVYPFIDERTRRSSFGSRDALALSRAGAEASIRAVAIGIHASRRVPSDAKALAQQQAHFRVMRLIEANPTYSQRDIARSLGISLGAVNYCLNALIKVGFVKVRNFRKSDNKLRYAYILTPKGAAEKAALTGAFLQRMLREYEALKAEIEALQLEAAVVPDRPMGWRAQSPEGGRRRRKSERY